MHISGVRVVLPIVDIYLERRKIMFFHVIGSVAEFCDEYLTFASSFRWEGTPQMSNDKSCLPYFAIFQACHIFNIL